MLKGYAIGTLLVAMSLILLTFAVYVRISTVESTMGEKLKVEKFYDRVVDVTRIIKDICNDSDVLDKQAAIQSLPNALDDEIAIYVDTSSYPTISYSLQGYGLSFSNTIQCS